MLYACAYCDDAADRPPQPDIALFNLAKLAAALAPCLPEARSQRALGNFWSALNDSYGRRMRAKLGLLAQPLCDWRFGRRSGRCAARRS